jgi:hypothetical protein
VPSEIHGVKNSATLQYGQGQFSVKWEKFIRDMLATLAARAGRRLNIVLMAA